MTMAGKQVVMVGSALDLPGGINAVIKSYQRSGLFARWNVAYLVSYEGKPWRLQLRAMTRAVVAFVSVVVKSQVLLLHVHSASRGSFWRKSVFCLLAWAARVPYVFHLHSGEFPNFYRDECGWAGKRWVRWVLRHADVVAVLTPSWLEPIRAIEPLAVLRVLPNPIDIPPAIHPVRELGQRLLFLGRLREKKGIFDLLQAMPEVLAALPEVRLCLAGDGDAGPVRASAKALGVDHALELPGWIDGTAKDAALAAADVLVLPSYFEGLPICVLEAMAAGVPVLATPVGGVGDALEHGRCGVLVPAGQPLEMAFALVDLLRDLPRRQQLAIAARERAEMNFGAASVARKVEALWHECSGGAKAQQIAQDERCEP